LPDYKLNIADGAHGSLGGVRVPPSKSIANRALLLASLAKGVSVFYGFSSRCLPDDILLMFNALRAMNAINANLIQDGDLRVSMASFDGPSSPIQVGEAGTVLRFLLPLVALHCTDSISFSGAKRLFERPLKPLLDALGHLGAVWRHEKSGGVLIPPKLKPKSIDMEIDGSLSSQFISGMAMAMAGLEDGGRLRWTKAPASESYMLLTKTWLERFSCSVVLSDKSLEIPGGELKPISAMIPGDWSAAAIFFCASSILGRGIEVFPLDPIDGQPDMAILSILEKAGSTWHFEGDRCHFAGYLNTGIEANLINCPDLAPILAATAAFAPGFSELKGLDTLQHKESDRLQGIVRLVNWLGGSVEELPNFTVRIHPGTSRGTLATRNTDTSFDTTFDTPFDPMGDHRMAFAAALGGLRGGGEVLNPDCVSKSFPGFWEAWRQITGAIPA